MTGISLESVEDSFARHGRLCKALDRDAQEADNQGGTSRVLTRLLETTLIVSSELEVSQVHDWQLDSVAFVERAEPVQPIELVPVFPAPNPSLLESAQVFSFAGVREMAAIDPELGSEQWARDMEPRLVSLPLRRTEYLAHPRLRLRFRARSVAHEVGKRFTPSQLYPVSSIKCEFDAGVQATLIHLSLPAYATVDYVALKGVIDWHDQIAELNSVIRQLTSVPEGERRGIPRSAETALSDIYSLSVGRASEALNFITDEANLVIRGPLYRNGLPTDEKRKVPQAWRESLEKSESELRKWQATRGDTRRPSTSIAHAENLLTILQSLSGEFTLVTRVTQDGSACIDLSAFVRTLGNGGDHVAIREAVIPFTSEYEPETQGKRSSVILLALGIVLLLLALVGISPGAPKDESGVRDAIVAVYLIFPAALYGQFFQSRPKTPIGARAQLGTFALLSLIFALPVIPAILAAIGLSFEWVAIASIAVGVVAVTVAVVVWRLFSDSSLREQRAKQLFRETGAIGDIRAFSTATAPAQGRKDS